MILERALGALVSGVAFPLTGGGSIAVLNALCGMPPLGVLECPAPLIGLFFGGMALAWVSGLRVRFWRRRRPLSEGTQE